MMIYEKKDFNFNENINEIIVKNIIKYRKEKGFTQEKLAYYTGLSNEFVRRVESSNGKRGYSINSFYKISVVLGVRIDKFFENTDI